MTNELKIKITGDIDDLKQALNEGDKEVEKFVDNVSSSIEGANGYFDEIGKKVGETVNSFKLLSDAPFSFGVNAKKSLSAPIAPATKLGGALSFISGGLGMASLAAVATTTAIGLLIGGVKKLTESTNENKKSVDDVTISYRNLAEAMDALRGIIGPTEEQQSRFIASLTNTERASLKGEQSAQKQIAVLRTLFAATQDTTLSIDNRKKAVVQLKSEFPDYFKNISDEKILAGEASNAYDTLTKSLIATAKARAYSDQISENVNVELSNLKEIANLQSNINKDRLEESRLNEARLSGGTISGGKYLEIQQRIEDAQFRINALQEQNRAIAEKNNTLQNRILENMTQGATLVDTPRLTPAKPDNRKTDAEKLAEELIKNDNRVQVAIREGRDKELEEARIKYEELYRMAKNNSDAIIRLADQESTEVNAINRKYDQKGIEEALKWENKKWDVILKAVDKGAKERDKIDESARKKRLKEEQRIAKEIYETQLYYSNQLGNAVGNALEDALGRGENFFKALRDEFKRTLIRMAADAAAAQIGKAIMSGISSSSGNGGGFWGFLGSALGWAGKLFGGSGSSSGSFPTGNYGGGNFPATNPIKGGGFSPGIQSSAGPSNNSDGVSVLRGNDIYMSNNRTIRLNARFNGGQ